MADKKITVPGGAHIRVELPSVDAATRAPAGEKPRRAVIFPPDEDEDLYLRRPGLLIFDLGYQLTDAHEKTYAEIPMNRPNFPADYESDTLTPFILSLNALFLADDPFSKQSGVQNRRPLKFRSENLYVDVVVVYSDHEKRSVIGRKDQRPPIDKIRDAGAENATRKDDWLPAGKLKPIRGGSALRVETVGYFHSFDTSNTERFKITEEPSYEAEEKEAALSNLDGIYLVPQLVDFQVRFLTLGQGQGCPSIPPSPISDGLDLWTRVPVEDPVLEITYREATGTADADARQVLFDRTESLGSAALEANYDAHVALNEEITIPECRPFVMIPPRYAGEFIGSADAPFVEGMLVGVLHAKGRTQYIWQRASGGETYGTFVYAPYDRNDINPI